MTSIEEGPGGFTRRTALKTGGLGIAALMSPALLAACGSGSKTGATPGTTGPVITGASFAPVVFDPHTASEIGAISVLLYVYEGLYGKSPVAPYPMQDQLATGKPTMTGDKLAEVKIRSGATFHDGSPVTAADVVASFERVLNPKTASLLAGYLSMIKKVRAKGTDTVEFVLDFPTSLLRDRLALVKIIPASLADTKGGGAVFNTAPIGSGPYHSASIARNLRTVRLAKFTGYNGPVKASLDKIGFDVILDDQARVAALQTKRLQAMNDPPFSAVDRLSKTPGLDAGGTLSFQQSLMMFNCKKPKLADKRVRQAILLAIDRSVITQSVFFGLAEPATSYLPKTNPDYKQPTTSLAFDPERARTLLKAAGATDLKVQINVSNLGWLAPQAPIIQSQLKDVGIDASIRLGETESLVKYVVDGSYDIWFTVTDPTIFGNSDGDFLIQWVYGNLAESFMYWTTPAADKMTALLAKAIRSTSSTEVHDLVGQMQDLIADEAPAFPLHHRDAIAAWSTGLDVKIDPTYGVNLLQVKPAA